MATKETQEEKYISIIPYDGIKIGTYCCKAKNNHFKQHSGKSTIV